MKHTDTSPTLIGMFDSPFVRRVAVSMRLLQIDFAHRNWSVGKDLLVSCAAGQSLPRCAMTWSTSAALPRITGVR